MILALQALAEMQAACRSLHGNADVASVLHTVKAAVCHVNAGSSMAAVKVLR